MAPDHQQFEVENVEQDLPHVERLEGHNATQELELPNFRLRMEVVRERHVLSAPLVNKANVTDTERNVGREKELDSGSSIATDSPLTPWQPHNSSFSSRKQRTHSR